MSKGVIVLNEDENHTRFSKPGLPWVTKLFAFIDVMRSFDGRPQDSGFADKLFGGKG